MEYDSKSIDFESNAIPFGSKSEGEITITIIFHSICKEIEINFSMCIGSLNKNTDLLKKVLVNFWEKSLMS